MREGLEEKLKALADYGIGGEKDNALSALNRMRKDAGAGFHGAADTVRSLVRWRPSAYSGASGAHVRVDWKAAAHNTNEVLSGLFSGLFKVGRVLGRVLGRILWIILEQFFCILAHVINNVITALGGNPAIVLISILIFLLYTLFFGMFVTNTKINVDGTIQTITTKIGRVINAKKRRNIQYYPLDDFSRIFGTEAVWDEESGTLMIWEASHEQNN
jgi:hypothetical protein